MILKNKEQKGLNIKEYISGQMEYLSTCYEIVLYNNNL
jgi:hypothetical protein